MNAQMAINLEDTLRLEETGEDFWKGLGQDEQDSVWSHNVLFDTRHQVSCVIWDFYKKDVGDPLEEVSDKKYWDSIASKEEVLPLQVEERTLHWQTHE